MLRDLFDGVARDPESGFPVIDLGFYFSASNLWPLLADLQEASEWVANAILHGISKDGGQSGSSEKEMAARALVDALVALRTAIEQATPPETAEPHG